MTTPAKRPTAIKVGHTVFDVEYLSDEEWAANPECEEADGGSTTAFKCLIRVRCPEGIHEIHVREVLLHELLHAAAYVSGVAINVELRTEPDIEETFIANTAPVLLDILRSNPKLVSYLGG